MVTRQRVVVTAFGGAFAHTDLGAAPNIAKRNTTAAQLSLLRELPTIRFVLATNTLPGTSEA